MCSSPASLDRQARPVQEAAVCVSGAGRYLDSVRSGRYRASLLLLLLLLLLFRTVTLTHVVVLKRPALKTVTDLWRFPCFRACNIVAARSIRIKSAAQKRRLLLLLLLLLLCFVTAAELMLSGWGQLHRQEEWALLYLQIKHISAENVHQSLQEASSVCLHGGSRLSVRPGNMAADPLQENCTITDDKTA